jgi:hypothetical protein
MIRKTAFSAIVFAFGATTAPSMAQNAPGATYVQAPWWYVGAGAVFMTRTKGTDVPLFLESASNPPSPAAPVAFSSRQLNTFDDFERGFDVRAGVRLTENLWLKGRFLWLATARGEFQRVTPNQDFEVPLFNNITTHFDDIDAALVAQSSAFHTLNVHAKYRAHRWFSVIGGFRYASLTEKLRMLAVDDGVGDLTNPSNLGTYDLRASNRIFGGELGLAVSVPVFEGFVVSLQGTAGAAANRISVQHNVFDSDDTRMTRNETNRATRFSFVGAASVSAMYRITSALSVYAGYELLYLTGLALSQREFNLDSTPAGIAQNVGVRGRGTALYHGGTVGMKLVF